MCSNPETLSGGDPEDSSIPFKVAVELIVMREVAVATVTWSAY